jgi:hypothetical protein
MQVEVALMEKKKEKNYRLSLVISILIAACLFVADLYIMINMPQNVLALAAVNVLFLAAIYYVIDAVTRQISAVAERKEEQYDSIFKSEKASYLLLRKTFDDLYELIEKGNQSRKTNVEDIIHAQKAVAKVSIGRNKENTDALMNSNDRIMEKISMLEAVLSDNVQPQPVETPQKDNAYSQDILENQNKILNQLETLQSLLNSIGADAKKAAQSAEQNFFTEERILAEESRIETEKPEVREVAVEEIPPVEEKTPVVEDAPIEEAAPVEEETPIEEAAPVVEETPIEEAAPIVEETPIEEETPVIEETPIGEELPVEDDAAELGLSDFDDMMVDTLSGSDDDVPVEKIPPEDETVVEDKPSMPDLSDPNKVMTPDEIAALIANL